MMSPSIFISCTSTTPATGDEAPTSLAPSLAVMFMNAPVPFWPGTVARTQASLTSTVWAYRVLQAISSEAVNTLSFMGVSRSEVQKIQPGIISGWTGISVDAHQRGIFADQLAVAVAGLGEFCGLGG